MVEVLAQAPLTSCHSKTLSPNPNPVTSLFCKFGSLNKPLPEIIDQLARPIVGLFADKTVEGELIQSDWFDPAMDVPGKSKTERVKVEIGETQTPLIIVQPTTVFPKVNPVSKVVGEVDAVTAPLPESTDQLPTPVIGVFPNNVVVGDVIQILWLDPAKAGVALSSTMMSTVDVLTQATFVILHSSVFMPTLKPLTLLVALFELLNMPPPASTDQLPTPRVGTFADKAALEVLAQTLWLIPAFAMLGMAYKLTRTRSVLSGQPGLNAVHCKVVVPRVRPVSGLLFNVGVVTMPLPDKTDQLPVPIESTLPASVVLGDVMQINWSTEALAVVGGLLTRIETVEVLMHDPFEIFHWKTEFPVPNPFIAVIAKAGFTMLPEPETSDHEPTPRVGDEPVNVVFGTVLHIVWLVPAKAVLGKLSTLIDMVEEFVPGQALATVHLRTLIPAGKPVTALLINEGVVTLPPPEITDHEPTPPVGVIAARFVVGELMQIVWLGPALAILGVPVTTMDKLAVLLPQTPPLLILQTKTLAPWLRVAVVVAEFVLAIVPLPWAKDQDPTPAVGVLADIAVVTLETAQMNW
jgi:hypothetical protein